MKTKICFITGSRADYGILVSIMKAIDQEPNFELQIIATCMHLMPEFGYTYREIQKDGFKISSKVDVSYSEDTGKAVSISIGKAIIGFTKDLERLKPQLVFVLGDRGEMLAAAVAANYLNIPVAHMHGGELSGHIDGMLRHAITRLAHLHFTSTALSRQRLIKMGEDSKRIFFVGAPAVDRILNEQLPSLDELNKKYKLNLASAFSIIVQHPVSQQEERAAAQIKITLDAVNSLKIPAIIVYPNADAGGRKMIPVINAYAKQYPLMTRFISLPHKDYLGLLKNSSVLIGNSSSAIIEASAFKIPAVNIGNRQDGRERGANVIDVGHDQKAIRDAISRALDDRRFCRKLQGSRNPYGDGRAGARIVKALKSFELNKDLLQKQITY